MLRISFIGLTFLLIFFSNAQDKIVKQTIIKTFSPSGKLEKTTFKDFNPQGLEVKSGTFDAQRKLLFFTVSVYDSLKHLIKETSYDEHSQVTEIWEYVYNEHDDLIQQQRYYTETKQTYIERYEITYNALGLEILNKEYYKDGSAGWVYKSEYDASNNLTCTKTYFNDTIRNEYAYTYSGSQQASQFLYDYENKKLKRELNEMTYYTYTDGLKTERIVHSVAKHLDKKVISKETYQYNKEKKMISETYSVDDVLQHRITFEYIYY